MLLRREVDRDLLGEKAARPYRHLYVLFVGVGAVAKLELVWALSDVFNGLMAFPNLVGLLALTPVIVRETKSYFGDSGGALSTEPAEA